MKKTKHLTVYELCKLFKPDKIKIRYTPTDEYMTIYNLNFLGAAMSYVTPTKHYIVNKDVKTIYFTLYGENYGTQS